MRNNDKCDTPSFEDEETTGSHRSAQHPIKDHEYTPG